MTPEQFTALQNKERELWQKALALIEGYPPEFNANPIVQLVRLADSFGFEVVRRQPSPANEERK